jgi:CRP-like cAMP-binding protein
MKEYQAIIDRLKKVSLFNVIRDNQESLKKIADHISVVTHKKGDTVVKEDEIGNELFIINSGEVEILKRTRGGDSYTVTKLSADMNIFFGEMALFDPEKRSATVTCSTDCEFYMLKRDDFTSFGDNYPKIGLAITREILKILCNRLRKVNADVVTLFDALVSEVEESGGLEED